MSEFNEGMRPQDRKVGRIILLWVSVLTALFVGVVILLVSHFVNTRVEAPVKEVESEQVARVDVEWYSDKKQYNGLPEVASLPSKFSARDILYTKEYQYSRALGVFDFSDVDGLLESLGGGFVPAPTVFVGERGETLLSFRSDDLYISVSPALGIVGVGYTSNDGLTSLNAVVGGESGDLSAEGLGTSQDEGRWQFKFRSTFKFDEEGFNNGFK